MRNYGDYGYTCNPHDDYMHVTGYTLQHGDSPHFLWGKHLQCGKAANVKNISSEIHNSPWKSSVDEKGPMNFFNVNNCMNAWESSNDHKKLKPCPQ